MFDQTKTERLLSEKQIREIVPVSRSTLQRWVAEKKFPAPVKCDGGARKFWRESAVVDWQIALKP